MYLNCKSNWFDNTSEDENWEFFTDQRGHWRWIKTDSDGITIGSSPVTFHIIDDCISNALLFGYCGDMDTILFIPDDLEMELIQA